MANPNNQVQVESAGAVVPVTDETFVTEVLQSETPVLVDFMAQWCGPCKFMGPIFAELAPQYAGKVKFAKLDVDKSPGVASALQIQSIPTFVLFKGKNGFAGSGAMPIESLREWIDQALDEIERIS